MAASYMSQQTDMFLSGRVWVVLLSKCRLLVNETYMAEIAAFYPVPSIPMFGICPFVLKHWIFKKNSKLHVHVLSKKPPKQQGHLMTCNVGANKYWVHV